MGAGDQSGELSLEQKQALALARARARLQQPAEEASGEEEGSSLRMAGLAARAVNPQVTGATLGGVAGSFIPGVGTVTGALAGASAATILQAVDKIFGRRYLEKLMTKMGSPLPQGNVEKLFFEGMEGAAGALGAGAVGRSIANAARGPVARGVGETLGKVLERPALAAASGGAGAVAQEAVRQEPPGIIPPELGGNQTEQFLANLAASAAAPLGMEAVGAVGRAVGRKVGDVGHAVGAAVGRQGSVDRLTADAVETLTANNRPEIRAALQNATEYVPGARPTVAEAIAEHNLRTPDRQVGGALVKLQDRISGHAGVEDVLPSKMKGNEAAVEQYLKDLRARTGMLRDQAFGNARSMGSSLPVAGKGPVWGADPTYVKRVIEYNLQDRGIAGHASARRAMAIASAEIDKALRNNHGRMDPEVAQGVRQTIAAKVAKHVRENPSPGDAVAIRALRRVEMALDDAIENGGASGWKQYMRMHAQGMKPVDQHVERLAEASRIAGQVQGQQPNALVEDVLPHIPNLLHRPTQMAAFTLRLLAANATDPVTKELAKRLQDPKQFLQLMNRPAGSAARQQMDKVLVQASVLENMIRQHQANLQAPDGSPQR